MGGILLCVFLLIYSKDAVYYSKENPEEVFDYEIITNQQGEKEITIYQYLGNQTDIIIPKYINGIRVARIGRRITYTNDNKVDTIAEEGVAKNVDTITLPPDIIIGDYAFWGDNIKKVIFQGKVLEIGSYAFGHCRILNRIGTKVEESDYCEIAAPILGDNIFVGCVSLKTVHFDNCVTYIANGMFKECIGLEKVVMEDGITEILDYAFSGCTGLKEIVFSKDLEKIGFSAFEECRSLTQINLPDSVKKIKPDAFVHCTSLIKISFPPYITEIVNFNFSRCTALREVKFLGQIQKIGDYAFTETGITEISLPPTVIEIGEGSFLDSAIQKIELSEQITKINAYAFTGCSNLKTIDFPDNIREIKAEAFYKSGNEMLIVYYREDTQTQQAILGMEIEDISYPRCPPYYIETSIDMDNGDIVYSYYEYNRVEPLSQVKFCVIK